MRSDFETIVVSRYDGQILLVTLNRPEVSNALNTRMGLDLMELFEALSIDLEGLRAVIITGSGTKAFCAGGDLKERNGMTDESWQSQHAIFERMVRAMMGCPIPLLAAVNGAAYGGGCEIAAASDFVYAATNARFALTEVTLGIMPGAGGTQNLARAVGERRAKELILSGLPFTAVEAEHGVSSIASLTPRIFWRPRWE
jgi:enoyl-CoA hydratase